MADAQLQPLNQLLADYQVYYQKLRNYHWNVRGPFFFGLHAQFEEMYNNAALRVDELAERISALGGRPASTLKEYLELSRLKEDATVPEAQQMVRNLHDDVGKLNDHLRATLAIGAVAEDQTTSNLLEEFVDAQEKTAWMLRSFLEA